MEKEKDGQFKKAVVVKMPKALRDALKDHFAEHGLSLSAGLRYVAIESLKKKDTVST